MYQQNDIERLFDITVNKAIPYLILSPSEFRNKLADQMDSLFSFYRGGESSVTNFIECNNTISTMLADARMSFDVNTHLKINAFDSRYMSFNERIRELDERLVKLERGRKEKKIEKLLEAPPITVTPTIMITQTPSINETIIDTSTGIDGFKMVDKNIQKDPSPIIEGMEKRKVGRPRKDATSKPEIIPTENLAIPMATTPVPTTLVPATQVPTKCPTCGTKLKKSTNKGGETYHCFKSRNGCGKKYVVSSDGILIEKTAAITESYTCKCGLKLKMQGKKNLDGEFYQIYSCNPPSQGGCGTGYIMDKDGNLHVGRGKIALSRPKMLKPNIQS